MALIKCSECGAEVSDKAVACPKCGNPIKQEESKLVLYGYNPQGYLVENKIGIYIDDVKVGEVGSSGGSTRVPLEIPIKKDCILKCKRPLGFFHKPIVIPIQSGKITKIQFAWNKMTGGLITQFVDSVTEI